MTAFNWGTRLPRSLFTLLGSGRLPTLYGLYLDVLVALYQRTQRYTTGTGLADEEARDLADDITEARATALAPDDEFADPDFESNVTVSQGAKILRRLEKAGWLRREAHRLTRQNVILFPEHAHALLPALVELRYGNDLDYDSMLVATLSLLAGREKLQRRAAIAQATRFMTQLRAHLQSVIHRLNDFQPGAQQLRAETLLEHLTDFLSSEAERDYRQFKLRHSPNRWFAEVMEQVDRLYENLDHLALEGLGTQPSFEAVEAARKTISSQLRTIEDSLKALVAMVNEMDGLVNQLTRLYGRGVQSITHEHAARPVIASANRLLTALRTAGVPEGLHLPLYHLTGLSPLALRARQRSASGERVIVNLQVEVDTQPPPPPLLRREFPGPREVERHFLSRFADSETHTLAELLQNSLEETALLRRLLDYCCLSESADFGFAIESTTETLPLIGNTHREFSNVIVRRHKPAR